MGEYVQCILPGDHTNILCWYLKDAFAWKLPVKFWDGNDRHAEYCYG